PEGILQAHNSGSTVRMGLGAVAPFPLETVWDGDASLRARPMDRVLRPLVQRGLRVLGSADRLPLHVRGPARGPLTYTSSVASAQVKTAVLLSGLYAEGETVYTEPALSRTHTEQILRYLELPLRVENLTLYLSPHPVPGFRLEVSGDPSAAAPFVVLGLLHPRAELVFRGVNLNPIRRTYLEILQRAGGRIYIELTSTSGPDPVGTVVVRSSSLDHLQISPEQVPALIDELPFLALAATFARKPSRFEGLSELRVKESDRYAGVCRLLGKLGARIRCVDDRWEIEPGPLRGGVLWDPRMDHRLLFLGAIAGHLLNEGIRLTGAGWAAVSHPGFFRTLEAICGN
ncbi:MAG: 3-phosphoshikimate 1-carboxyvinyltransferase, partial [Candidatus Hydrothermae bacterium]|nr:3-phosphoshikimate 1-carboxyvinyltransferase [Candidatus Hydrothermae bacterium]